MDDKDKKHILIKDYLKNRLNYLLKKVNDPLLYKLKLFAGNVLFPAFDVLKSKKEINIIDNYTIGLYPKVEKEAKELLLEKPEQFDLYNLYIKSLIYQKKPFDPIGNPKSIQNQILLEMHRLTSVEVNPKKSGLNLLRLANNLTSTVLSYGISDFVFFQTGGKKERNLLARMSYNLANPIISEIYTEDENKRSYLNFLSSKFPNSITISFFKAKLSGIQELKNFKDKIPKAKYKVEYAKKLQEEKNHLSASKVWKELINNYSETPPIFEIAVNHLFICYEELEQYDECINLYIESYFKNNYIVEKIETQSLLKKISSSRFKNITHSIELPIFYTLSKADDVEAHLAFELFNSSMDIEKPSELFKKFKLFNRDKITFYLKTACSPQILKHSTYINNSKERLEERLAIINFLKTSGIQDKQIDDEIKSIQNILVIQQGLIDLDESKIYVNEQGILENELKGFEAIYERFKIISDIGSKGKLFLLAPGKLTSLDFSSPTERKEDFEYSLNPAFDIFMELFAAVKEKFLHSQFGIVAYLSTRIRHGVLVGEIRPVFEKYQLITLKEGNTNNYRTNHSWEFHFKNLPPEKRNQLQTFLQEFSGKVDGLIFDLIKRFLQVHNSDSNPDGWFDYSFDQNALWFDSVLSILSAGSHDFDSFVKSIFEILWNRTDENLELIRDKILNDILTKFNSYLDELERNILSLLTQNQSQPIIKQIKGCSTELQTVIQKISRWFKRSEIKAADFQTNDLFEVIINYTNKINPYKKLLVKKNFYFNCNIKGVYKTHFADLFRIFLENIVVHSDEKSNQINCEITTQQIKDNILNIEIQNEITDESTLESLNHVWSEKRVDVEKLGKEGKSGFPKAFKILTSDLKSDKNYCLHTETNKEQNLFIVKLSIKLNGLTP